jgi:hypothetical protein
VSVLFVSVLAASVVSVGLTFYLSLPLNQGRRRANGAISNSLGV